MTRPVSPQAGGNSCSSHPDVEREMCSRTEGMSSPAKRFHPKNRRFKGMQKNSGGRIMPSKRLIAEWGNSSSLIVIRRWLEIVDDKQ